MATRKGAAIGIAGVQSFPCHVNSHEIKNIAKFLNGEDASTPTESVHPLPASKRRNDPYAAQVVDSKDNADHNRSTMSKSGRRMTHADVSMILRAHYAVQEFEIDMRGDLIAEQRTESKSKPVLSQESVVGAPFRPVL